jgi:predicted Ser/Thr protein kinase
MAGLEKAPMTEPQRCPHCGTSLAGDAPAGICPRCVLALAIAGEPAGEFQVQGSKFNVAGGLPSANFEGGPLNAEIGRPTPPPTVQLSPAARFVAPQPHELAPLFPQLEILELLGQGGMGAVYQARQTKLDRLVALKILPPEVGQDPAFAERFAREARTLGRLSHPEIVAIHDFGQAGSLYYLVMEFVDGQNLRQLIQGGQLSPQEALAIVPKICEALQYAHDEGVVHRDIKPENILLDKKGRVKIADFGLAKMLSRPAGSYTLTDTHQVMGTPHYMAPEQIQGSRAVDHRADIYSLGVVFYEMLTGELPLGRFEPPSKRAQVDVRLDDVVLRALERSPDRRYQQASEVRDDVQTISGVEGTVAAGKRMIVPPRIETEDAHSAIPDALRTGFDHSVTLMFCSGILGVVVNLFLLAMIAAYIENGVHGDTPILFAPLLALVYVIGIPIGLFVCVAAILLARLRWFYVVKTAAFVLMLPWSFAVVLGLPIGFWTFFFLLARPEIRQAFARAARLRKTAVSPKVASPTLEDPRSDEEKLTEAHFLVRGPAIGMMVVGVLAWVQSLGYLIFGLLQRRPHQFFFDVDIGALPFMAAFGIPYGVLTFVAGWQMLRLRTYTLGVLAAVATYFAWLGVLPLLALPVAIWTHIVLWKPVVCDAFAINLRRRIGQSGPAVGKIKQPGADALGSDGWPVHPQLAAAPSPAAKRSPGTLGRAWDAWWAKRDWWFAGMVQALLALVSLACLILYLNFHTATEATHADPNMQHVTVQVGYPTPWCRLERYPEPGVPFQFNINFVAWSSLAMLVGCLAWFAYWQIERAKPEPRHVWLGWPTTIVVFWGTVTVVMIILGFAFLT